VTLHREIAYVRGDVALWPALTGGETIDLLARMRGGLDEDRRADLIERFDLDPKKEVCGPDPPSAGLLTTHTAPAGSFDGA
jgi:ABC-type multidrug transport system ATPase subunit